MLAGKSVARKDTATGTPTSRIRVGLAADIVYTNGAKQCEFRFIIMDFSKYQTTFFVRVTLIMGLPSRGIRGWIGIRSQRQKRRPESYAEGTAIIAKTQEAWPNAR